MAILIMIIYGALLIGGGAYAYSAKASLASLIAGGLSGVLMFLFAYLAKRHRNIGTGGGAIVAVLLTVMFVQRYIAGGKFMPSGMMGLVSLLVSIILVYLMFKTPSK